MIERRDKHIRVSKEFDKILQKIAEQKVMNGTAKINRRDTFSDRRITLAMTRHPKFKDIVEDISLADLE